MINVVTIIPTYEKNFQPIVNFVVNNDNAIRLINVSICHAIISNVELSARLNALNKPGISLIIAVVISSLIIGPRFDK